MAMCRTCLKTAADKDITELEMAINEINRSYFDIMMFCLNIEVSLDSKITTKLCNACFVRIITFYEFKQLSTKNDLYLKFLHQLDKKPSEYIDENGVKHENFLDTDQYGPSLIEDCSRIKIEIDVKDETTLGDALDHVKDDNTPDDADSDKEPLSVLQKIKHENMKDKAKGNAPVRKKLNHSKKMKHGYQVCEECGKSVRNLKLHSVRHLPAADRKTLQCNACPKLFCTKGSRREHFKTAHLGLKSKCHLCNKEVVYLSTHMATVHNPDTLRHGCVSCGRRFNCQSALATHMITHTKDADAFVHECEICHMKFSAKGFLSRHMRQVHEKERKYQCEFCSKAFFTKYALERHIRSHTKERPYKCEECGKSFTNSISRKNHMVIHTGERNYRCEVCDMTFMRAEYLRKHMVSHTKEKKFPCRYCGRRFGRGDHRRKHEITAHQKHLAAD